MRGFISSFLVTVIVAAVTVHAQVKSYIPTEAEYRTECKTCPRSLCPNKLYYSGGDGLNATCWTHGTKIMGDNLWLKTEAGCYITQYDVLEYAGDYTTDLKYCGPASEVQKLTLQDAKLKYKTECRICPELSCDVVSYLNENTELDLTCWYPDGQLIIDDPFWLKTTNNCYVARKNLYSKPDLAKLDDCGPVPFLEILHHNNENGTSDVNKREPTPEPEPELVPAPIPKREADMNVMYLVNVTVGEEYAYCRSCPKESCKIEKTFEFNNEVWLQCLKIVNNLPSEGPTEYWALTTDFCYMNRNDFWEDPAGDFYRFPSCDRFEQGGGSGGDED
ncbi:hypothetical protein GGP41_009651 [Bipolaris sorokiniana]|uniref:Cyanovirin-N domain-containing protein n=2 Tax=Cochliobolus sativus TaxID=45130 RepID=A0A8H6DRJ2_COCSA|nr:uncharacterized protein COCSADRAFT_151745 [Bipolaris sorokiniana ND90Pr]EMD60261.1 hypothetical protein COCSADRAFT_151745 [Bipolaris sorokiniana ND90Pr]KAF5845791.1 hypothetical protein GGP41_009651 [Bipolaris sorokiniana]